MSKTLYHHTVGTGPDLVLVHGWGMHSGIWQEVVASLQRRYRVTLLDLPGHGYSRTVTAGPGLADLSAAVCAVTPPRAAWVGWSLGGLVAQHLALTAPERVTRLVLVSTTPCFMQRPDWPYGIAPLVLRRFAEELRQDYRAVLQRFIALETYGSARASAQLRQLKALLFQRGDPDQIALEQGLRILETADLRAEVSRIAHPTLLLMGQRDQLTPAAAGQVLRDWLPHAQSHCFAHAGHAPFLSHAVEFVAQLEAFLDG